MHGSMVNVHLNAWTDNKCWIMNAVNVWVILGTGYLSKLVFGKQKIKVTFPTTATGKSAAEEIWALVIEPNILSEFSLRSWMSGLGPGHLQMGGKTWPDSIWPFQPDSQRMRVRLFWPAKTRVGHEKPALPACQNSITSRISNLHSSHEFNTKETCRRSIAISKIYSHRPTTFYSKIYLKIFLVLAGNIFS